MEWLVPISLFLFGLFIGSFLNVVIWRLPRGENIVTPRSHCTKCGRMVSFYDNIPVLSYLLLGGKCRYCREPISAQYPLVELLTGTLFAASWFFTGANFSWDLLATVIFVGFGIAISGIDLTHRIIPDELSVGGLIIGLILSPLRGGSFMGFAHGLLGAAIGALLLYLARVGGKFLFKKEAMGWGDVKLIAMIGAFVGFWGVLLTIFEASVLGAVGGGVALFFSPKFREDRTIPFGPYLIAAGLITLYFGDRIMEWYLSLMSPV